MAGGLRRVGIVSAHMRCDVPVALAVSIFQFSEKEATTLGVRRDARALKPRAPRKT
jgi:hypothetical protein